MRLCDYWQGVQGISPPTMLPVTMYSPGGQGEPCIAAGCTEGPHGVPAIVGGPATGAAPPAMTGDAATAAPATTGCW
jgi:hypothetical protein